MCFHTWHDQHNTGEPSGLELYPQQNKIFTNSHTKKDVRFFCLLFDSNGIPRSPSSCHWCSLDAMLALHIRFDVIEKRSLLANGKARRMQ